MKHFSMRMWLAMSIAFLCFLSGRAQSYRGFVDLEGLWSPLYGSTRFAGGVSTTHGIQISRNFFVGAGGGYYFVSDDDMYIPVFAAVRYDLFQGRRCNFFAQCRLGYTVGIPDDSEFVKNLSISSFLVQPSIGVRIKLASKVGMNIALTVMPLRGWKLCPEWNDNKLNYDLIGVCKTGVAAGISAGVDF